MGIGKRIKTYLDEQKKTVRWLSKQTGINENTLYAMIKRDSDKISPESVVKISEALSIDPMELLGFNKALPIADFIEYIHRKNLILIYAPEEDEIVQDGDKNYFVFTDCDYEYKFTFSEIQNFLEKVYSFGDYEFEQLLKRKRDEQ